jgi:AcrR family transcriptional regulator
VARPKTPLITRERVVEASLAILRSEGAGALSLRRIGQELGVNAASIYHHFTDKDEILGAVARTAIAEVVPPAYDGDLRNWVIGESMAHYRYFVANPFLVPLLAQGYLPRRTTTAYQANMARLRDHGFDADQGELLLAAVETLVLGGALLASVAKNRQMHEQPPGKTARVNGTGRGLHGERRFEAMLSLLVDSTLASFGDREPSTPGLSRSGAPRVRPQREVALGSKRR